ncbi:MAG: GNAT family N-acetyltransferase, partial [Bacteroidetes bacterium]|nr:GNAT family N-acetyltransferase [Bacteroidota bacterium]
MLVHLGNGRRGIRILIAGNTQVSGSLGLFFNTSVSNALQADVWKSVIENAEEKWGPFAIILAKEFNLEQEKETIKALKAANLRKISALPVMMMNLDSSWQSFQDYLAAMSAKYRIRAKSARKKGKHISSETWGVEEIALHLDQIEELYENVYSRARFRLMRIDPLYFLRLKQNLGKQFRFQAYFAAGRFIGFRTSFCYNNRLDAHLIGLDYEANKEHSLYLNMLYDYVELALENGCTQIDFGRTAMEIKSTVGAEPVDFLPLVKIRNTILNGLTCVLMENSAPEPWVQRHPFREEITTE